MKAALEDPARNVAREEAFPRLEDRERLPPLPVPPARAAGSERRVAGRASASASRLRESVASAGRERAAAGERHRGSRVARRKPRAA